MARTALPPLKQQVARVRRRLFLQTLLNSLIACWLGVLAVSAVWLLLQPYFLREVSLALQWTVLGSLCGAGTLLAGLLAYRRSPSLLSAALSLDERFHLKERVTTVIGLTPEEDSSSAGRALFDDASRRVESLQVAERFPIQLPWTAALVPLGALLLSLLALFYKPQLGQAKEEDKLPLTTNQLAAEEIKDEMKKLQKKARPKGPEQAKSRDLEKLEEERDRLSRAKTETREDARQVVKEMGNLEEQMQKRDKELAQRVDALKEQMKQAERLGKKEKLDGPANKMDRALQQGDLKQAREEAERLAKQLEDEAEIERLRRKLDDPKLDEAERERIKKELEKLEKKKMAPEQKEKLRQQLKEMKKQIDRLSRNLKEQQEELEAMEQEGELNREELERELEQLRQNAEKIDPETLKKLRELAQKIGECEQALRQGKDEEAAEKLQEAANMLDQLEPGEERDELARQIEMLRQCRRIICEALDGGGIGEGRRPLGEDGPTKHQETRERAVMGKGQKSIIDHVPGEGFKGPRKPAELTEEIRQAAQEAPEALDRQRLPRSASDMARSYFEKLRGPDKKDK